MKKLLLRAGIVSVVALAALFLYKLSVDAKRHYYRAAVSYDGFEISRKNYASFKKGGSAPQSLGNTQKYEKIATLRETTRSFDDTRKKVNALISETAGLVQYEQQQGLTGRRVLQLGIGIPPVKFEDFIKNVSQIGRVTHLTIVKNDKTNEYRQLNAKRQSLQNAKKTLLELAASGGSVDERLKVHRRLAEVEEEIQNLSISLGDFDTENEFCTVKLTLAEIRKPQPISWKRRVIKSAVWAVKTYLWLASGFLMVALALWLSALALSIAKRLMKVIEASE
ncbi:MAG: DUF4349 domain-containing protein [Alphaproteobacteria bacterium]